MSGNLPIILIVVMWIFVLAPLLLRGQRPIERTSEALDETRVVYTGGSGPIKQRRTRAQLLAAKAPSAAADAAGVDGEVGEEDYLLVDDLPPYRLVTKETGYREEVLVPEVVIDVTDAEEVADVVIDGEIVPEPDDTPEDTEAPELTEAAEAVEAVEATPDDEHTDVAVTDEVTPQPVPESYLAPADLLLEESDAAESPTEVATESGTEDDAEVAAENSSDIETELTAEDIQFAERRRGRGGFDPASDAAARTTLYQRRQRTFAVLAAALVLALIVGAVLQGMWWIAPVLVFAVLVFYLYALAKQVQAEKALREQRIRHMRRARLGVRQNNAAELGIPERLRTPAGVVVELDDESVDFAELPAYTNDEVTDLSYHRPPRLQKVG